MKPDNNFTAEVFTEDGHEEYISHHPNEKYFLHIGESWQSDGTLDIYRKGITQVMQNIKEGTKDNTIQPWCYISKKVNRGAAYIYIEPKQQQPESVDYILSQLILIDSDVSSELESGQVKIKNNPTEELYIQIVTQF